jgi:hypothetical protein
MAKLVTQSHSFLTVRPTCMQDNTVSVEARGSTEDLFTFPEKCSNLQRLHIALPQPEFSRGGQ